MSLRTMRGSLSAAADEMICDVSCSAAVARKMRRGGGVVVGASRAFARPGFAAAFCLLAANSRFCNARRPTRARRRQLPAFGLFAIGLSTGVALLVIRSALVERLPLARACERSFRRRSCRSSALIARFSSSPFVVRLLAIRILIVVVCR